MTELRRPWLFLSLFILFSLHLLFAHYLPLTEDELYYWTWSKHLQGGYYDHPPMVAVLIKMGTSLFSDSALGIRLMACITSFATILVLLALTPGGLFIAPLIYTPLFFYGGVLMTPDIPLLFFWISYVGWLAHMNVRFLNWEEDPMARVYHKSPNSLFQWGVLGVLLGMGILSKYTMALAIPVGLFFFLKRHHFRGWGLGYLFHLLIAFVVTWPLFFHNVRTDFASFVFQWNHAMNNQWGFSFSQMMEMVGGVIGLLGALPFLLAPFVLLQFLQWRQNAKAPVYFYFYFFPLLFFLYRSGSTKVEANWPLVAFLSFFPLAAMLQESSSSKKTLGVLGFVSFLVPHLLTAFLWWHWYSPFNQVLPHKDRLYKMMATEELFRDFQKNRLTAGLPGPLFTTNYQWTSFLRFNGLTAQQLEGASRPSEYTQNPIDPCVYKKISVFSDEAVEVGCFKHKKLIAEYPLVVRGQKLRTFQLWEFHHEE